MQIEEQIKMEAERRREQMAKDAHEYADEETRTYKENIRDVCYYERTFGYEYAAHDYFIHGANFVLELMGWVKVVPGCKMPEVYPVGERGKGTRHVLVWVGGKTEKGIYFPDRFKTVEFEDWDDFKPENYPHMIDDADKGCVWLKEGWYQELYNHVDDHYFYEPISPSFWQQLPPPPKD